MRRLNGKRSSRSSESLHLTAQITALKKNIANLFFKHAFLLVIALQSDDYTLYRYDGIKFNINFNDWLLTFADKPFKSPEEKTELETLPAKIKEIHQQLNSFLLANKLSKKYQNLIANFLTHFLTNQQLSDNLKTELIGSTYSAIFSLFNSQNTNQLCFITQILESLNSIHERLAQYINERMARKKYRLLHIPDEPARTEILSDFSEGDESFAEDSGAKDSDMPEAAQSNRIEEITITENSNIDSRDSSISRTSGGTEATSEIKSEEKSIECDSWELVHYGMEYLRALADRRPYNACWYITPTHSLINVANTIPFNFDKPEFDDHTNSYYLSLATRNLLTETGQPLLAAAIEELLGWLRSKNLEVGNPITYANYTTSPPISCLGISVRGFTAEIVTQLKNERDQFLPKIQPQPSLSTSPLTVLANSACEAHKQTADNKGEAKDFPENPVP